MSSLIRSNSFLGGLNGNFLPSLARRYAGGQDDVTFTRPDLINIASKYETVKDCLSGQEKIKSLTVKYLPMPNVGTALDSSLRYQAYLERAVFYNVTGRTLSGMLGQIFVREPAMKYDDRLLPVIENADGTGLSIEQVSQVAVRYLIAYGRAGIFVDFPPMEGADRTLFNENEMRPFMRVIAPWDIINWRIGRRGGRTVLTLVVIRESYESYTDKFALELRDRYYVLRLDEMGEFIVDIYSDEETRNMYQLVGGGKPKDSRGQAFTELNFKFIGSENNSSSVDDPPLYDLAELNIAHYRNSADYQKSSFLAGQPSLIISGLDETWANHLLGGEIIVGADRAIMLPENGRAELIQAGSNSQPYESMRHIELQMAATGARILERTTGGRTATETRFDVNTENSTLASIAKNASDGVTDALRICQRFLGVNPDSELEFSLNSDFELDSLSPEKISQIIYAVEKGALSWEEGRELFRHGGLTSQTDEIARVSIQEWMMNQIELERLRTARPEEPEENEAVDEETDEEGGQEPSVGQT